MRVGAAVAGLLRDRSVLVPLDGYRWVERRRSGDEDVLDTGLLGSPAVCVRGPEGARFFYEQAALKRSTALPEPVISTLFGHGAVHTLDDEEHRHRKAQFTDVVDAPAAMDVAGRARRALDEAMADWDGEVDLFREAGAALLVAACGWAGVELDADEVEDRRADMVAMIDGFGGFAPRQVRGRLARRRSESWLVDHVRAARAVDGPEDTPLRRFAAHRDITGNLLDERVVAVEVLNLIRPTVAIAWLVGMGATALDRWPHLRAGLDDPDAAYRLAQEVRRYYPFAPFLAARAETDLEVSGHRVPRGALVVLDVWGTNHDPATWPDPWAFDPSRYLTQEVTPYNLLPQGGGDRRTGHRCPADDVVLSTLAALLPRLAEPALPVTSAHEIGLRRMPPQPDFRVLA